MQTLKELRQLYDYNKWANCEFFQFFEETTIQNEKAIVVFAHLLLTELTWLRRMLENLDTSNFDFWAGQTPADVRKILAENEQLYVDFFAALTEEKLENSFYYKNSRGLAFENTWREALMHVFLHSSYHRGQVAQAIRSAGNAPPYTDFIQFLRLKQKSISYFKL